MDPDSIWNAVERLSGSDLEDLVWAPGYSYAFHEILVKSLLWAFVFSYVKLRIRGEVLTKCF